MEGIAAITSDADMILMSRSIRSYPAPLRFRAVYRSADNGQAPFVSPGMSFKSRSTDKRPEFASAHEKWRGGALGRTTDEIERRLILELIGDVRGKSILDIGCGDGELAVALAGQGANVTVLCFIDDPKPVLSQAVRVLRPGGRLVIGELGRWNAWAARRRIRGWFGRPIWSRARFRTAADLQDLVNDAGLVVEQVRGAVFYPPLGLAAKWIGPMDHRIARLTTFGAAFLAVAATKSAE